MMKKVFLAAALMMPLLFSNAGAQEREFSAVKLSLWHPLAYPQTEMVKGLDFGVISTITPQLKGLQMAFAYAELKGESYGAQAAFYAKADLFYGARWAFVSKSRAVRGYDASFVGISEDFIGYQAGFVTKTETLKGVQGGFVNIASDVSGLQFGIVNYTHVMNGVQIGLLNFITESRLPVMVLVNARFE